MRKLYIVGTDTGNRTFGYINAETETYTELAEPPLSDYTMSLVVASDDNAWIGYSTYLSGYWVPVTAHWNGSVWTVHLISDSPITNDPNIAYGSVGVRGMAYVSDTEIYAAYAQSSFGSSGQIARWDGASWTTIGAVGGGVESQVLFAADTDDVWYACDGVSIDLRHWNGSTFDEVGGVASSGAVTGICKRSDGEVFALAYVDAKLYRRTGPGTWAEIGDLGGNALTSRGPSMWLDLTTDHIYMVAWNDSFSTRYIYKYSADDVLTQYATMAGGSSGVSLYGVPTPAGPYLYFGGGDSGVVNLVTVYPNQSSLNVDYSPLDIWRVCPQPIQWPPRLQNQDPAPAAANVLPTSTIAFDLVDDNGDLNASSVVIKVNTVTVWTGDAQQSGYTVTKTPVANGFRYEISSDAGWDPGTVTVEVYAEDLA